MKVHSSAIVHPEAKIDPTCEIGPFCIIGPKVTMGPHNKLESHVVVENRVTIGEGNTFFPFCVVGAVPQDLKYRGEDTEVIIGNFNSIRESVTINLGTAGGSGVTRIGDHNLLMAYVHLGHDSNVGSHTVVGNSCQVAGHVEIQDWAIIGGVSAISQFVRVGAHTYVGGFSGMDRDLPPFAYGMGITSNFEIKGINLVGLKRRGFKDEEISALQEVSKLFFKDKSLEKEVALRRVEEKLGALSVVRQFIDFVRAAEKGIYR